MFHYCANGIDVGFLRERLRSRQKRSAVRADILRRFPRDVDVTAGERCRASCIPATVQRCSAANDSARQRGAYGSGYRRLSTADPHRPAYSRGTRSDRSRRALAALPASCRSADTCRTPHATAGSRLAETSARRGVSVDSSILGNSKTTTTPGTCRHSTCSHTERSRGGPATGTRAGNAASAAVTWRAMILRSSRAHILSFSCRSYMINSNAGLMMTFCDELTYMQTTADDAPQSTSA